ncbi:MAG: hypothetical protein CMP39_01545, partial [Rickettsiales bacterium]|nr:hypothetical protein [Rickettsiales bacterium]
MRRLPGKNIYDNINFKKTTNFNQDTAKRLKETKFIEGPKKSKYTDDITKLNKRVTFLTTLVELDTKEELDTKKISNELAKINLLDEYIESLNNKDKDVSEKKQIAEKLNNILSLYNQLANKFVQVNTEKLNEISVKENQIGQILYDIELKESELKEKVLSNYLQVRDIFFQDSIPTIESNSIQYDKFKELTIFVTKKEIDFEELISKFKTNLVNQIIRNDSNELSLEVIEKQMELAFEGKAPKETVENIINLLVNKRIFPLLKKNPIKLSNITPKYVEYPRYLENKVTLVRGANEYSNYDEIEDNQGEILSSTLQNLFGKNVVPYKSKDHNPTVYAVYKQLNHSLKILNIDLANIIESFRDKLETTNKNATISEFIDSVYDLLVDKKDRIKMNKLIHILEDVLFGEDKCGNLVKVMWDKNEVLLPMYQSPAVNHLYFALKENNGSIPDEIVEKLHKLDDLSNSTISSEIHTDDEKSIDSDEIAQTNSFTENQENIKQMIAKLKESKQGNLHGKDIESSNDKNEEPEILSTIDQIIEANNLKDKDSSHLEIAKKSTINVLESPSFETNQVQSLYKVLKQYRSSISKPIMEKLYEVDVRLSSMPSSLDQTDEEKSTDSESIGIQVKSLTTGLKKQLHESDTVFQAIESKPDEYEVNDVMGIVDFKLNEMLYREAVIDPKLLLKSEKFKQWDSDESSFLKIIEEASIEDKSIPEQEEDLKTFKDHLKYLKSIYDEKEFYMVGLDKAIKHFEEKINSKKLAMKNEIDQEVSKIRALFNQEEIEEISLEDLTEKSLEVTKQLKNCKEKYQGIEYDFTEIDKVVEVFYSDVNRKKEIKIKIDTEIEEISGLIEESRLSENSINKLEEIADSVKKKLHDLNNTGNEVKYDFNEIIKKVADFNLFIKISKEEMMKTSVGSILDFFNEFKQDLTTENKVVLCDKLMTHFIKEGHNKKSIIEALKLKLDNSGIDNELKLFIDMILEFISIDFKDLNEEVAKELFGDKLFDKYVKYKLDPKLLGGQKIEDRYFFNLSNKQDVEDQKQAIENYNKKLQELHPKYRTIAKEFEDNFKSLSSLLTLKEQSINKAERNKLRQPMKSRPKEIQLAENERHSLKQILSDFNRLSAEEAAKKELFELFTETPLNNMSKEKLTDISGLIIKIKNEEKKGFDSGNIEKTRLELKESELEVRLKLSEFDYSSRQDLEEQKELLNILNKSIDGYLVKLRKIPTTKKKTVFPFAAREESTDNKEKTTNIFKDGANPFAARKESTDNKEKVINIFKDGANPFAAIQAKKSDEKEK